MPLSLAIIVWLWSMGLAEPVMMSTRPDIFFSLVCVCVCSCTVDVRSVYHAFSCQHGVVFNVRCCPVSWGRIGLLWGSQMGFLNTR